MPTTTPAATSRTLLVAEDEDSGRAIAAGLGAEYAATLRLCSRPDHTLREVEAHRPDVIVFALASLEAVELRALALQDVPLPGADGVDLIQRLKNTPDLAAIPVVMFTGEARRETLVRSVEARAADFLAKPFRREALVAKLAKYLPALA